MQPTILALATALPQFSAPQDTFAAMAIKTLQLDEQKARFLESIYARSGIKRRYSVLPDFSDTASAEPYSFWHPESGTWPQTRQINDIYLQEAPKLAQQAAQAALSDWQGSAEDITHVISVSCTGVMAPGIEFLLQEQLGLKSTVQRLGINFMGCFGAFRGLAIAASIAKESPKHRILLVCTELCSLHFQPDTGAEHLVGSSIFADGAAAIVVGQKPQHHEKPLWNIKRSTCYALPNSLDKMSWVAGNYGFIMGLSVDVPKIIKQQLPSIAKDLADSETFSSFTWALHPGGRAILEGIEDALELEKLQTYASWQVLADHGNMSSATFLFVLQELAKKINLHPNVIGLGFGPGLSVEGIVLQH